MIEAAEADGRLKPGGTIVEATAGNTGSAWRWSAASKGYRTFSSCPTRCRREKSCMRKALGAEVRHHPLRRRQGPSGLLPGPRPGDHRQEPGAFYINQFENPANPPAHEATHRPGNPGGRWTATSTPSWSASAPAARSRARALSQEAPRPRPRWCWPIPPGSILAPFVETGRMTRPARWLVEGIGEDFVPPNCDLSLVKKAYSIGDKESFSTARELLRKEGILAGSSTGTLLAAALRYCREQTEPKRVVTLVCDTGAKYLSKVFNDAFIAQEGWLDRKTTGTARDVVINPFGEGATIFVSPSETLRSAFARMRSSDISQLPVIEDGRVVGLIDESDILDALVANEHAPQSVFDKPVRDVMVTRLQTISADAPVKELLPLFAAGLVPVIMDGDAFVGLATRIDLINYFRIQAQ